MNLTTVAPICDRQAFPGGVQAAAWRPHLSEQVFMCSEQFFTRMHAGHGPAQKETQVKIGFVTARRSLSDQLSWGSWPTQLMSCASQRPSSHARTAPPSPHLRSVSNRDSPVQVGRWLGLGSGPGIRRCSQYISLPSLGPLLAVCPIRQRQEGVCLGFAARCRARAAWVGGPVAG